MITAKQAAPGTKVKIPTRKTVWQSFSEYQEELKKVLAQGAAYGTIASGKPDDRKAYRVEIGADWWYFTLADLDLYDLEVLNPTSHPLSEEEVATKPTSYPLGYTDYNDIRPKQSMPDFQNEQDRRDYFMVEGKEKILQDAMNKICSWPKNDTFNQEKPVFHEWAGIKVVADLESPVYCDPAKPTHYNDTAITALAVIDDWQANFRIGNALKYLARYQKKGTPIQDLEKCIEYVRLEIERLKAE